MLFIGCLIVKEYYQNSWLSFYRAKCYKQIKQVHIFFLSDENLLVFIFGPQNKLKLGLSFGDSYLVTGF